MQITAVLKIFSEERAKNSDIVSAVVETRIRLSTEVASQRIQPLISEARWKLFTGLIQSETFWLHMSQQKEGATIVVSAPKLPQAYEAIERAFESLFDEYAQTSEYFQGAWPRDLLIEMACSLAVARQTAAEELASTGTTTFHKSRAKPFVDVVHWAQIGLVGEIVVSEYASEVNNALAVIRSLME